MAKQRTDTERLNWIVAHSAFVSHSNDCEVCNVWLSHDNDGDPGEPTPFEGYPQKCYASAREAIDACIKSEEDYFDQKTKEEVNTTAKG